MGNYILCGSNDLCELTYRNIIETYLEILDNSELNEIYLKYTNNINEFLELLYSFDKINFNLFTNKQKCDIFKCNKIFDKNYTIEQCINSLKYSELLFIKNKKQFINIIKKLYKDQ